MLFINVLDQWSAPHINLQRALEWIMLDYLALMTDEGTSLHPAARRDATYMYSGSLDQLQKLMK
jgi:hypothetical protein